MTRNAPVRVSEQTHTALLAFKLKLAARLNRNISMGDAVEMLVKYGNDNFEDIFKKVKTR